MSLRLLALAGTLLVAAAPVRAQAGFVVEYPPVQSQDAAFFRHWLMQNGQVDRLAQWLNGWIRMPRQVGLRQVECTSSDIRWNAAERAVEMCYRMHTRLYGLSQGQDSLRNATGGAHLYMTLHAVAHAIIDELDLSVGADEEVAVDELSALMFSGLRRPGLPLFVLGGIGVLHRADPDWGDWDYVTAHRLGPERFRNVACLVYGIDPGGYDSLRAAGLVDDGARQRCRTAALRVVDVWSRRLGRHLR
jgi:hypothetical protein